MNAKTTTLSAAAVAVFFALVADIPLAAGADNTPQPDDSAAAATLNNTIASCNKSEDERFQAQQAQFQRERQKNQDILTQYQSQNDAMHKQYDDLRANYALLELTNDQEKKQNDDLREKYTDMQQKLQEAQAKYDDILKAAQEAAMEEAKKKEEGPFQKLLGTIRQGLP